MHVYWEWEWYVRFGGIVSIWLLEQVHQQLLYNYTQVLKYVLTYCLRAKVEMNGKFVSVNNSGVKVLRVNERDKDQVSAWVAVLPIWILSYFVCVCANLYVCIGEKMQEGELIEVNISCHILVETLMWTYEKICHFLLISRDRVNFVSFLNFIVE